MANKNKNFRCNYVTDNKECRTSFKDPGAFHDHWMRHMAKDPEVLKARQEIIAAAGIPEEEETK